MKDIIEGLNVSMSKLEEKLNKRDEYYDSKTVEWKNSEKGAFYDEKTEELEELKNDFDTLISDLKTWDESF